MSTYPRIALVLALLLGSCQKPPTDLQFTIGAKTTRASAQTAVSSIPDAATEIVLSLPEGSVESGVSLAVSEFADNEHRLRKHHGPALQMTPADVTFNSDLEMTRTSPSRRRSSRPTRT